MKKITVIAKHTVTAIISFICAYVLVKASFSQELINNGQAITNGTGSFVLFFSVLSYIYYAYFSKDILFTRFMMCTGFLLIFLEYSASLIINVDLNMYTSIFWCDCGILGVLIGIFNNMLFYLFRKDIGSLTTSIYKRLKSW